MYIFIGLGNPGAAYAGTRHNIGRETLLAAARAAKLRSFELNGKWNALVTGGKIEKRRVAFLLPETFVNKSGAAVAPAARALKTKPERIVLIHDDVDLLLGATKLSFGRNSGGHKGVESVMRALRTKNFWRMRIGVQKKRRIAGEDLVLQKFRGDETATIQNVTKKSIAAIEAICRESPAYAMNDYNR